jgi:adenine-specific DNA-methyltransferase
MAKKKAASKKVAKAKPTPIDSIRHNDTRKNIPTEELRDFVSEEELAPQTLLYPRDPSLDPQLVWKGKDEQDRQDLAVPVVPIYIQEKIHPQAIVDDLLSSLPSPSGRGAGGEGAFDEQLDLFADFNGLPEEFDQRIDFYQHDGHWSNRMILGDSLLVMTSLAEKEGLRGQVQTIYLDPPYGIKFGSNWQVSTRKRDVKDGKAEDATRQPEQVRAFRDTWKLGIHSYLAYLRDRLVAARELLTETGSVFVQIGEENVHRLRCVMDEVFGDENFCAVIPFVKTGGVKQSLLAERCDYLLWYARDIQHVKYNQLYVEKSAERGASTFTWIELPDGTRRGMTAAEKESPGLLPQDARIYRAANITTQGNPRFPFTHAGKTYTQSWKTTPAGMQSASWANRLHVASNSLSFVQYLDDFPVSEITRLWTDTFLGSFAEDKVFVVQTSTKTVERCLLMTTDPGDLVLDPTCGSGTTAYVAEQWGRRWITCDTSRVALALARTRLMAAKYPYYYLAADYPALAPTAADEEIKAHVKKTPPAQAGGSPDVRKGFVYKRVPHVTLKSIANNPDIKEGMTRAEIDAAIARHADTETLFDQPYEDKKRLRVSGPFTVESLSPHRTISVEEKKQRAEVGKGGLKMRVIGPDGFATMIIDNLRKAGVQNTVKNERLKFDSLNPYAGEWIHAEGHYTEADGTTKRAGVCIGPEHGTVGAQLIKEAAKEAVKGVGFDLLIVCGFAFDPSVSEETKRYGKLTVLPARMNPDLAMGDELLKKTGAGNLFTVFGEPDMEVKNQKDGQVVVEIKGLDVYDPTTGEIRNSSTDDIACWFIDTAYNGESFFVRHAYFTGADEPYDKLKRALKAEIDEAAWSSLYSTTSRPFARPETGKIAVKVINHYGDEVLKVFAVE